MSTNTIKDFISLIDGLPEVLTKINQEMSAADKRVTEVYHKIERTDLSFCYDKLAESYLLMIELKAALKERRKVKDKHAIMSSIRNRKGNLEELKLLAQDLLKLVGEE